MVVLLGASAACSPRPTRAVSTPSATPSPISTSASLESCGSLKFGVDGTVDSVLCPEGKPNAAADAYFRRFDLRVLALGAQATPGDVDRAICDDLTGPSAPGKGAPTIPAEGQAVRLAVAEQGWRFALDPADHIEAIAQGCVAPSPT